jgi:RimJ/RimL family protein N-acetyltransferase
MGAVREAVLRQSFAKNGRHLDQALFTILERDWRAASTVGKEVRQTRIH